MPPVWCTLLRNNRNYFLSSGLFIIFASYNVKYATIFSTHGMIKTDKQQASAAAAFAERWAGRGYEKGDSQVFWTELLSEVYGIDNPSTFIRYEEQVKVDKTNFIDGHIPTTKVLIEQKSLGKDLRAAITQSDGSRLNPFQQAKRYAAELPYSQRPRWIVTCNFEEFLVYDMEQPNGEPESILLKNLGKEYYRLQFLVKEQNEHLSKEMQVSMQAGEIVGRIYDALLAQYDDNSPEALRWLNILCVRIVFCLYAEDAGIFVHDQFHDYLAGYEAKDTRNALIRLFEVLNKPIDERSRYLMDDLKAFPYTNGGLFAEEIEIPQITDELRDTLLQNASHDFDWSEISPTIFGAVFESTLNPETRRSGGMHYTSIENIHKVIDPLFMNDLKREFHTILEDKVERNRNRRLDVFRKKISSLTFLDPACGSGNFLTETYLSLRRLENEIIRERYHGDRFLGQDDMSPIMVNINQFYGIEINDFAVTVAITALWISEAQMLAETERIIHQDLDFLPLKSYTNIREGNALLMDWDVIETKTGVPTIYAENVHLILEPERTTVSEDTPRYEDLNVVTHFIDGQVKSGVQRYHVKFDYIMGNPPFVGARLMSANQKAEMVRVFGSLWKSVGNLDYVACWYKKALDLMSVNRSCRAAFVSTNSICQGEQVANLWEILFTQGVKINFAYRTFRWDSEATLKAHVHCVIVGFSLSDSASHIIFDGERIVQANNINAYLIDAPDVFVNSRQSPICDVPAMVFGNMANDGGHLILSVEEKDSLMSSWQYAGKYIRAFVGADEFINNRKRYCLWLKDASPVELRQSAEVVRRIEMVRKVRSESKRSGTRKMADYPSLFGEIRQPEGTYLLVPRVSSERRRYVPIGFMDAAIIASDAVQIIPSATLYHFGVLTSNVHMAWMRVVCGRLKSDYRYSKDIVYNNFPWPTPTDVQRLRIGQTAQAILEARAEYPDSSLADLYDELTMPAELRKAHQENDRAVMQVYGFDVKTMTESQCVAELFKMYQQLRK